MAEIQVTIKTEKRWLLKHGGTLGLLVAYIALKCGAPIEWFFHFDLA